MEMNLPNKLTILRVLMIPIIMCLYLIGNIPCKIIAIILFLVAAYTDHLDGSIARKRNLVTDFGKFLDPIADKLLVLSVMIMLVVEGTIPSFWGAITLMIVITREFIVSSFRLVACTKGIVIAADKYGKWKTVTQYIALPLCMILSMIGNMNKTCVCVFASVSYTVLVVSLILTVLSGINYIVKNKEVLNDNKKN